MRCAMRSRDGHTKCKGSLHDVHSCCHQRRNAVGRHPVTSQCGEPNTLVSVKEPWQVLHHALETGRLLKLCSSVIRISAKQPRRDDTANQVQSMEVGPHDRSSYIKGCERDWRRSAETMNCRPMMQDVGRVDVSKMATTHFGLTNSGTSPFVDSRISI